MKELTVIRESRKLSQNALSKLSGVPQATISRYEKGLRVPDSGILRKLALALRCSADDLLGIAEEVKKFRDVQVKVAKMIIGQKKDKS